MNNPEKMHILQPKHTRIRAEEVSKLLSKYNIAKEQLPKIKASDPVITELNAKTGDVIRILRRIEDIEEEYYRIVV